jgi:hypothetical protein
MVCASIPKKYLARVRTAEDEGGVKWGESDGEDIGLGVSAALQDQRTGEWKMNSGRSSRWRFQTATIPSGSFGADGFLLYDATASSGN